MPKPTSAKKTSAAKSSSSVKKLPNKPVKPTVTRVTENSDKTKSLTVEASDQTLTPSKPDVVKYEIQARITAVKPEAKPAQPPVSSPPPELNVKTNPPAKSNQVWWWMLVGLFIGFASVMAVYFLVFKGMSWPVTYQATPTPVASVIPATPEPEVDLSQYSVEVLNGAGIAGIAGKVKDLLNNQGFAQVEIGNASAYDYQETEISLKADLPEAVFEKIKLALADYTIKQTDDLSEDEVFDVKIIVGQLQTSPTSEPESEEGQI